MRARTPDLAAIPDKIRIEIEERSSLLMGTSFYSRGRTASCAEASEFFSLRDTDSRFVEVQDAGKDPEPENYRGRRLEVRDCQLVVFAQVDGRADDAARGHRTEEVEDIVRTLRIAAAIRSRA